MGTKMTKMPAVGMQLTKRQTQKPRLSWVMFFQAGGQGKVCEGL